MIIIILGSLRHLWIPLHLGHGWFKLQSESQSQFIIKPTQSVYATVHPCTCVRHRESVFLSLDA